MTGTRIASGLLAVVTLVGATACSSQDQVGAMPDQPVAVTTPTAGTASPPAENLTPLQRQALANVPGKTFTSAIVDFPAGAHALPHRHGDAFVYAYVLEGTVRSQVDDQPVGTFGPGKSWIEQPGAHHAPRTRVRPNRPSSWSSSSPTPGTSSRSTTPTDNAKLP